MLIYIVDDIKTTSDEECVCVCFNTESFYPHFIDYFGK